MGRVPARYQQVLESRLAHILQVTTGSGQLEAYMEAYVSACAAPGFSDPAKMQEANLRRNSPGASGKQSKPKAIHAVPGGAAEPARHRCLQFLYKLRLEAQVLGAVLVRRLGQAALISRW